MRSLLLVYANLCLLRRGPERVPTHAWFVIGIVVVDLLFSIAVSVRLSDTPALYVATSVTVSMATTALITWLLLQWRGFVARYPATVAAIFGCDLIFTALLAGVEQWITATFAAVAYALKIALALWAIAVNGFILHRAMAVRLIWGLLIAFFVAIFSVTISGLAIGARS
jgi:hypothetical protein